MLSNFASNVELRHYSTVMLKQTFDFEHVMRHCHLHDDPGVAGVESAIFKKDYTRRRLLGGTTRTIKERVIPYVQKFTPKDAVGRGSHSSTS